MLYFYYGTDGGAARAEASARLKDLQTQFPRAAVFRMHEANWNAEAFSDLLASQGLLHDTTLVHLLGVFENEEAREYILARLSDIAASPSHFIFAEGALDAEVKRAVTKHADFAQEYKKPPASKEKSAIFALADALGRRDKKSLWVLYQRALIENHAPESINGMLFWKVKDILTVRPSNLWSVDELKHLSGRLVSLYHDSHRGKHDFEIALERLVLTI